MKIVQLWIETDGGEQTQVKMTTCAIRTRSARCPSTASEFRTLMLTSTNSEGHLVTYELAFKLYTRRHWAMYVSFLRGEEIGTAHE
jgi:hypothetical protein